MNAFTIKDIENLSGVKAHTIRIWEQRYNFLKPQRTDTNIRYYSNDELKMILNIALLNRYGYKISHINKMELDEINQKILGLPHSQARFDRIVNDLVKEMVDFNTDAFGQMLDEQIRARGIDATINDIVFPFLEKVGLLWITNNIIPAQEHLVSNIIRQKLIAGIEQATIRMMSDKTVLLFLPEGEHHELGLLYVHYLLKNHGVNVLYLGADVPLSDLEVVLKAKKVSYVYIHLSSLSHKFNFEKFLKNLPSVTQSLPVAISGPVTTDYDKAIPPNISFIKSLDEAKSFFQSI